MAAEQRELLAVVRLSQRTHLCNLSQSRLLQVGHELRTPLTGVAGAAALLARCVAADSEAGELVSILASGASRLGALLDDLLDFGTGALRSNRALTALTPDSVELWRDADVTASLLCVAVGRGALRSAARAFSFARRSEAAAD